MRRNGLLTPLTYFPVGEARSDSIRTALVNKTMFIDRYRLFNIDTGYIGTVEDFIFSKGNHPHQVVCSTAGILLQAIDKFHVDCDNSWMIGDRERDIEAAVL